MRKAVLLGGRNLKSYHCPKFQVDRYCSGSSALDDGYVPSKIENLSFKNGYFDGPPVSDRPFSIILPPPNITGNLHLGHALTVTVEDVIIRWNKMRGRQTLWVPGIDHAGIATQVVVEKKLWKERGLTRHDLGREGFQDEVWKWKAEKAQIIEQQLKRLGASVDWARLMFTMDESQSNAVKKAFVELYEAGLIYRADYLVNWSCVLQSAISDIEVEHLEVKGPTMVSIPEQSDPVEFGVLTKFAYKLHNDDSGEEIVVATTRPETMLGDVAVAVHPQDDRYKGFHGRYLWHPFRNQPIPVICDDFVDPAFGTGAVKVTPAHDHADFQVGKRHKLKRLEIINERGLLTELCGEFSGLRRFQARKAIVTRLDGLGLLRGKEGHDMTVPICSRSKDVVEFLIKPQWFLRCKEMAEKAVQDVKEGRLQIEPKQFEKTWFSWLENIRDWCISRQLWWGHQIPAFKCYTKSDPNRMCWIAAEHPEVALLKACKRLSADKDNVMVVQDEDVLDTWFSSSLLPFSALGWPRQTEEFGKFYPLSLMETGHDILFFWVARMVMLGNQLTGHLPFRKILLHGIVCDSQGRKMSKSLGNVLAPEEVIGGASLEELEEGCKASHASGILSQDELTRAILDQRRTFPEGIPECGADALRFTLCSHNVKSHTINFDVQECKINKFFGNKVWQAVKFSNKWMEAVSAAQDLSKTIDYASLSSVDKWILSRLNFMDETVTSSLDNSDFYIATSALKNFLYYEFCDVYLETTKRGLRLPDSRMAAQHCFVLTVCLRTGLKLLSPFMPRLSQHLHQHLRLHPEYESLKLSQIRDEKLEDEMNTILNLVIAIRRLKKLFNMTRKHNPKVFISTDLNMDGDFQSAICDLSACEEVNLAGSDENLASDPSYACDRVAYGNTKIYLYVPGNLRESFELDVTKMSSKLGKLQADLEKLVEKTSVPAYLLRANEKTKEINSRKISELEEKIARIQYMQSLSTSRCKK